MPRSIPEQQRKNPPPVFTQALATTSTPEPRILHDAATIQTFLRFLNVLVACGTAPMTVSEVARVLAKPAPRIRYQVGQLLKLGLLQVENNGPQGKGVRGRGTRYRTNRFWSIPHTALPHTTFQDFLTDYFRRSVPVFVAACAQQMQVSAHPWRLDFDFAAPELFQIQTEQPLRHCWSPLVGTTIVRLTADQAQELHAELSALLHKYNELSPWQPSADHQDYLLGTLLAQAPHS